MLSEFLQMDLEAHEPSFFTGNPTKIGNVELT